MGRGAVPAAEVRSRGDGPERTIDRTSAETLAKSCPSWLTDYLVRGNDRVTMSVDRQHEIVAVDVPILPVSFDTGIICAIGAHRFLTPGDYVIGHQR